MWNYLVSNQISNSIQVIFVSLICYYSFYFELSYSEKIFWEIFKHRWALFVTYTIIQSITSSEMCSLHLTHPSAHTPGAVGSRHCGARGAVVGSGPCSRVSPQSWTIPAGAEIRTHNLRLKVLTLCPLEPQLPQISHSIKVILVSLIYYYRFYFE